MNEATIAQTLFSLALFLIFLGFLIWGIKSGQFKDVEEAKYQIIEEEEEKEPNEDKEGDEDERIDEERDRKKNKLEG